MNNFLDKAAETIRSFLDALSVMGDIDWSSSEVNYTRLTVISAVSAAIMFLIVV